MRLLIFDVFYFITFTLKWLALAVAAVSAELSAILLYKMCKILQFLCRFVNSAQDGQSCARWPILCKILRARNRRILISLAVNTDRHQDNI